MVVLRACYKHGVKFDESYYREKHLPLAAAVMGPHGLKHVELVKVTSTFDGSAPPYQFIFSAHFESAEALQSALQSPRIGEVLGDIPNYYVGMPDVMIGEVVPVG